MSNTVSDNLTREKIQQLLASVGVESEEDTKGNMEASECNWGKSHYFNVDQVKEINNFAEIVARKCTEKFAQLYNNQFNVKIDSVTQHFGSEFIAPDSTENNYYLAFDNEGQPFGLVCISCETAFVWVTQLLGDTKSEEDSKINLSQLECSLLFDVASSIVEAFSDSSDNYDLQPHSEIIKDRLPVEPEVTEELCKITFNVEQVDSQKPTNAYLLILCDKINSVVEQDVQAIEDFSAEDIAKAMHSHVNRYPLSVAARLGSAILTFEEVISLQVDDILLLDKSVNDPADLIIEGKTILQGRLVKSDGKHAMLITDLCNTD